MMHDPRALARRNMGRTRHPARKEVLVSAKLSLLQPDSNCGSRRLRQLELHRPLGFSLGHHSPKEYLGSMRNVAYSKRDEVEAAKLAVDSQVEHSQIALTSVALKRPMLPTTIWLPRISMPVPEVVRRVP